MGRVRSKALDAGKHVYCEKPMTRYAAEGWAVHDKVKSTGKVYTCGSQYTADPVFHKVADWVKSGKLGPLVWAQSSYCRNNKKNSEWTFPIDADANPAEPRLGTLARAKPRKCHGAKPPPTAISPGTNITPTTPAFIGNLLSHRFYALMLATGTPEFPRRVVCTGTRKVSTDRDITDTTHVLAEFPSGLTFVIAGTTVNEVGLPDTIRGRKATAYLAGSANQAKLQPEKLFSEEMDVEEFNDPAPYGKIEHLHANFLQVHPRGRHAVLQCGPDRARQHRARARRDVRAARHRLFLRRKNSHHPHRRR
jgi:predicted dehydrogenase